MPYIGKTPASVPVTSDDIPNNSITSAKILDNVITIADIGPNAVGSSEMADDAVGLNELSAGGTTNTTTFLRGDNSWAVPPNTVYTHPNHSGDVTSTADGATVIGNNKVITDKILNSNVTTAKIADDAVTAAKLANSINTDIATGVTGNTTANAALPKSGGTMTGVLNASSIYLGDNNKIGSDAGDYIKWTADTKTSFVVNGSERMAVTSSGNLGIGIANPTERLEIYNSSSPAIQLNDGNDYKSIFRMAGNDLEIRGSSGSLEFYNGSADGDSSAQRMTITAAGKVGIGTAAPTFENGSGLEIRYAGGNGAHLKLTDNASGAGGTNGFDLYSFNTAAYIENYEAGAMVFRNNGAERMRITSAGKVGIGTSAPDVLLDVGDSDHGSAGNAGIQIQNSQAFATVYGGDDVGKMAGIQTVNHDDTSNRTPTGIVFVHRSSSSGIAAIQSTSAAADRADLRFVTRGSAGISEKMIINDDGKVGIGVTALTRQLAIGTLGAKTDTATKYVMNIGQTTEASSHAGLGVYFKGHANAASRLWQFQPTENGVANDGIVEMNPNGGYFRANRGVLFGTDTAAANILDDYEEGTWTPSTNIGYASGTATYIKIGNLVHIRMDATTNAGPGDNSQATSVSGLPYAASPGDQISGSTFITGINQNLYLEIGGSGFSIRDNANNTSITRGEYGSSVHRLSATYMTAF